MENLKVWKILKSQTDSGKISSFEKLKFDFKLYLSTDEFEKLIINELRSFYK